jgi:hypothetical protein
MTTKQIKHLGGHVPAPRGLIGLVRDQSTHHCSMVGTSPCWGLLSTQPCQPEHHAPEAHHVAAANCGLVVRGAWLPPSNTRHRAHKALQWHRPTPMNSAHDPISLTTKSIFLYQKIAEKYPRKLFHCPPKAPSTLPIYPHGQSVKGNK